MTKPVVSMVDMITRGIVWQSTDNKTYLDVLVEGGVIRIKELQLSGKKRMKTEEFLRGFHIEDYSL